MNIPGLDYNTQRPRLVLPEYGREVQRMVDLCRQLPDRDQRLACAKEITRLMLTRVPSLRQNQNYQQTLWDHLYLMAGGDLDIDWPMSPEGAKVMDERPQPVPLDKSRIRLRHYGRLVEELCKRLRDMPEGDERDELAWLTANQMRRMLIDWGHGSMDGERVLSDLADMTDGRIQIDVSQFQFEEYHPQPAQPSGKKKRKK